MEDRPESTSTRRSFLASMGSWFAVVGMMVAWGQFGRIVLSYLYPRKKEGYWFFVATTDNFAVGQSMEYIAPDGQQVAISRMGEKDFVALSSVCPHLGCKVYWESNTSSFFCPCHNGRFDSLGRPTEGPPAQASQHLSQFPLKIEWGLLYIQLSRESLKKLATLEGNHHKHCHKDSIA